MCEKTVIDYQQAAASTHGAHNVPGPVDSGVNSMSMKGVDFESLRAPVATIDGACDDAEQTRRPRA